MYTHSISSSTRNVAVSLRPVTRILANLRALSLPLAARTPPLARASPFARTTDTRIDTDTTRRCSSRFATTIQSSRILFPRCRRPPPCCRTDRLSSSNRRRCSAVPWRFRRPERRTSRCSPPRLRTRSLRPPSTLSARRRRDAYSPLRRASQTIQRAFETRRRRRASSTTPREAPLPLNDRCA